MRETLQEDKYLEKQTQEMRIAFYVSFSNYTPCTAQKYKSTQLTGIENLNLTVTRSIRLQHNSRTILLL